MIFDCPRCEAENAIPISEIPEQGKVVSCLGCKQPFRVLPPDPNEFDDDETANGDPSETTAISEAPSMSELMDTAGAEDEPDDEDKTAGMILMTPSFPASRGPTVQSSSRLPLRDHDLMETRRIEPEPTGRVPLPTSKSPSREIPAVSQPAPPPPARAFTPLPPRALVEPASREMPLRPATTRMHASPLYEAVARIPLAARVGLAVFPLALLLILLIGPGGSDDVEPIELSAAAQAEPRAEAAPSAVAGADSVADTLEPEAPKTGPGLAADAPAPQGHAYVDTDEVRVKSQAGDEGTIVARLRSGALVRRIEQVEESVLVLAGEKGPAGFVPVTTLSARMPVALLAERHAFQGCAAEGPEEREACLTSAKDQHEGCVSSCESTAPPEGTIDAELETLRIRCRSACTTAQERCNKSCERRGASTAAALKAKAPAPAPPPPKRRTPQPLPGY